MNKEGNFSGCLFYALQSNLRDFNRIKNKKLPQFLRKFLIKFSSGIMVSQVNFFRPILKPGFHWNNYFSKALNLKQRS
jgi:hypothetical protein